MATHVEIPFCTHQVEAGPMEVRDSTILITRDSGSFGSRVAKTLQEHGPKQVRIYNRGEEKQ